MLLMSVSDVVFTMVPDVTNMALPYCECGLSMAKSIPGMLGRMASGPRCVSLMHPTAHCRVFPRNNKVWAHGPMSLKFDGPFL